MKTLFTLILLSLFSSLALAYDSNSLTWQKLALEEKVQRKVNTALSAVLKDNQYLVEVEVEVTDPGAPNFGADNKSTGPKVSDLKLEESRGDYIAFSKIGLEVPVLDKFLDEDRTKLMNLYRFNETYDLFKNLAALKITVSLSDKLPEPLAEIARKVVNTTKLMVSGVKPAIKFESIPLEWVDPEIVKKALAEEKAKQKAEIESKQKPVQEEPKIWAKDWYEWASRWGNAFGLILASLIVGGIALALFFQWKKFMENFNAAQAKKDEEKKEEDNTDEAAAIGGGGGSGDASSTQEEEVSSTQGYERFQQCLNQHPEEAVTMLREWINDGEGDNLLALRAISQQATPEEMDTLKAGISDFQKDKWKELVGAHLSSAEVDAANKFIFQEVVRTLLVPSRIKDGELLNLVMELTPKTSRDFMESNEGQIGILMNILGPSFVGKIIGDVSEEVAEAWLNQGASFPIGSLEEHLGSLKASLEAYKKSNGPSPFAQRLMAMIPNSIPSRETTLYKALAKAGNPTMVLEVAKKCFPNELVLDLPGPFLKEVIQSYPMAKRVELIFSRPEEARQTLINTIAEPGTPAREMIDMEIDSIKLDAGRQSRIVSNSDLIWQDFVKLTRTSLAKSPAYQAPSVELIEAWSQKLSGLKVIDGGKAAA